MVYMKNKFSIVMHSIDTYKLVMQGGHILYLYDILYAPNIQWNLFSILVMLKLDFHFYLENNFVKMYLRTNFYGCDYFLNVF